MTWWGREWVEDPKPKKGEGKSRNSVNYKMKIHYQVGAIAACNSLVLVPTFTKDPKETNCLNCKKWLTSNGIKND